MVTSEGETIAPSTSTVTNYGAISSSSSSTENVPDSSSSSPTPELVMAPTKSTLNFFEKVGYGLGHVYNDLSAGVWFSYTLLFLQGVLKMSSPVSGALVMVGQVGDAIATPIAGYIADRFWTKRNWHILGSILVLVAFPSIFSLCPLCMEFLWWEPVYFTIVILIFQFGWATVQVTHLSMIPELSRTQKDRSDLTAIRYSVSVFSNVVVFLVTWAVLHGRDKSENNISPSDGVRFRDICLILTLTGTSMTVLFHFSLVLMGYDLRRNQALQRMHQKSSDDPIQQQEEQKETEPLLNDAGSESSVSVTPVERVNFLKSPLLYKTALLYVFSRLFMTTSLVYMPLWLNERTLTPSHNVNELLGKSVEHIATVPLVSFLASFIGSVLLKYSHGFFDHRTHYFCGSLICISACAWVGVAVNATGSSSELYGIAILFGTGSSITMISSLCITADMIGIHSNQGGLIYSAVTFADKLITGIVIIVIESIKCKASDECPEYYKNVLSYGCGIASILGLVILCIPICSRSSRRHPQTN